MIIVSFQNVVKEYNGAGLFDPVTFQIDQKERIALVGPNGTGKSTIIKMIIGELEPDQGKIVIGKEYKIGYLSQSVISDLSHSLYDEAVSVYSDAQKLEQALSDLGMKMEKDPDNINLINQYSDLETKFVAAGGYDYHYKVDTMLTKFGFVKDDYSRAISSFSGGERMKMAFAKLLLISPDLLILDEPTNHLDISTIEWLEDYLKSYAGSLLFVSHDRYFINALAQQIFELDQRHLEVYTGDYDAYSKEKTARYEQRLKTYKMQQKEAEKLEWFIKFYMPKPRFASRAHDREKKLIRLQDNMIDKPTITKNKINMTIDGYVRQGKRLIELKDVSIGYDKPLISGISFVLYGGDKFAVMGQNGSGKTTLIKCLLHQLKPLSGSLEFLTLLNIGYLRQDGINISSPLSIFDFFKDKFPQMEDQEIYDHLGSYGFNYDDDKKIIDTLSGGERMRVVFAELVLHHYDLLLLDEPTNHLDMMTKEELIDSLQQYQGSMIVVSHDRYFVDCVCNKLVYFYLHKFYYYEGRYSDFKKEVFDSIEAKAEEEEIKERKEERAVKDSAQPQYIHTHEDHPRPRLALNKIEEKMGRLEKHMAELKANIDNPDYYSDSQKMTDNQTAIDEDEKEYADLLEMMSCYEQ